MAEEHAPAHHKLTKAAKTLFRESPDFAFEIAMGKRGSLGMAFSVAVYTVVCEEIEKGENSSLIADLINSSDNMDLSAEAQKHGYRNPLQVIEAGKEVVKAGGKVSEEKLHGEENPGVQDRQASRFGKSMVAGIAALFAILTLPLGLLNMTAVVVAAVWLAILRQWIAIGFGVAMIFLVESRAIALLLVPYVSLASIAALFFKKDCRLLGFIFALPPLVYLYGIITVWAGYVLWIAMTSVTTEAMLIPMILGSYAVATSPWVEVALGKNRFLESYVVATAPWEVEMTRGDMLEYRTKGLIMRGSVWPLFFLEVGYIVIGAMILLGQSTFYDAMAVFAVIMIVGVLSHSTWAGVLAWKAATPTAQL
jgi:hypothetical protein